MVPNRVKYHIFINLLFTKYRAYVALKHDSLYNQSSCHGNVA